MNDKNTELTDADTNRSEDLKRRMKAALALAGIGVEELAQRINLRGYGAKTLYNMQGETGARPILPRDQEVIARACGLSPAFFTIDFGQIPADTITDRLHRLEQQVQALLSAIPDVMPADPLDVVAQLVREAGVLARESRPVPAGAAEDVSGRDRQRRAPGDDDT